MEVLRGEGDLRNRHYRRGRNRWPIHPKGARPQTKGEAAFVYLKGEITMTPWPKGAGVLDLPGDLEASGHKSGNKVGTTGKHMGCQEGTAEFPENLVGRHAATGQGSGGGH